MPSPKKNSTNYPIKRECTFWFNRQGNIFASIIDLELLDICVSCKVSTILTSRISIQLCQKNLTGSNAYTKRRTSKSRFFIDYLGIFNETEGTETSNSQRVKSYYDILKTKKLFWRPVFVEYFRDPFTNIENRVTVGTGMGYNIIDTNKFDQIKRHHFFGSKNVTANRAPQPSGPPSGECAQYRAPTPT